MIAACGVDRMTLTRALAGMRVSPASVLMMVTRLEAARARRQS